MNQKHMVPTFLYIQKRQKLQGKGARDKHKVDFPKASMLSNGLEHFLKTLRFNQLSFLA